MSQNCKVINIKQIFSLRTKLLMVGSIIFKLHNIHKTTTDHSNMKNVMDVIMTGGRERFSKVPDCTKLRCILFETAGVCWSLIL